MDRRPLATIILVEDDAEILEPLSETLFGGRMAAFGDLDLASFLAGAVASEDSVPLAATLLAPLRERPYLLETLECWFANDCDSARTASALSIQPNSLRYRLTRIEELLGQLLRSPQTIASLYLALAVDGAVT